MNPFMLDDKEYGRDVDILKHYKEDAAFYIHKRTGKPFEQCMSFVERQTGAGGKFEIKDPNARFLVKSKPGCRTKASMPFTQYLKTAVENQWILSPTLATYQNPRVKRSLLANYISGNIRKRSEAKNEMFEAKVANDTNLEALKSITQTSLKIKNNSLSGAHASPYTVLYNKSSHSTLTSTCRSATGYGNANNEKFLLGNRHYWSPEIVKANIISIVRYTDLDLVKQAVETYNIHIPTAEQCMDCIRYSTMFYWKNDRKLNEIRALVESLSDLERAAFMYVGDLYHLAKHTPAVVREFLDRMSTVDDQTVVENPDEVIKSMDSDLEALVKYLCVDEVKSRSLTDIKEEDSKTWNTLAATALSVQKTLQDFSLLIRSLWSTKNVPASVASLPGIIRRGAVASDTDSTIFTVQNWTEWFTGKLSFDKKSNAIRDVMAYLSSMSIAHVLKLMVSQLGVVDEDKHRLSMKNEYTFPVFALTNRSKHYFAFMSAQEGNTYKEYDLELKGVALRNSNSPENIREKTRELVERTMLSVVKGERFSLTELLKEIAAVENDIYENIMAGKYDYYRTGQIKTKDSYKNPESSPYQHYDLWQSVFAETYGHAEQPPYAVVKVSVNANNPTNLRLWLDRMEDQAIALKLEAYLKKINRNNLTTLWLPEPILQVSGVPKEIIAGVDVRKLIGDTMEPIYLVLESIGYYVKDPNNSRLVSDLV